MFVLFFTNADMVFACKMARPYIKINIGEQECIAYKNYINVELIDETNISEVCHNLILSDSDKTIILELINQYKADLKSSNYVYFARQSTDEYLNFLQETKKINSKICSCDKFMPKDRKGDWTIYIKTYKNICTFSTACFQPPAFCPNSANFILLLIYIASGITLIVSVVVIIKAARKRKNKNP